MTAFNYAKPKSNATKMLTRYGQNLTITNKSISAYDPTTGTVTDSTSTQTAYGVILEWGDQGSTPSYGKSMIDKSLIIAGDKRLLLSASIAMPALDDTVTDVNGKVYSIKMIKELAPSGTAVLYEANICGI